jgi:hypothetical protein
MATRNALDRLTVKNVSATRATPTVSSPETIDDIPF